MGFMKKHLYNSRNIGILSIVIFLVVAGSMVFSTCYMNQSIQAEERAQTERMENRQQGEDLADASDYLTEEVRNYAVTGDISHFYNYWCEIYDTKQREKAIADFESGNPPQNEKLLLKKAKEYSDLLVETETCSMKMVLTATGVSPRDWKDDEKLAAYITKVLAYQWEPEMDTLTSSQLQERAIHMLYDENYSEYKKEIMTPIEEFQVAMNARLNQEVENRKRATRIAALIQIVLAVLSIGAIGFVLSLLNKLYVIPLKRYTREIKGTNDFAQKDFNKEDGALQILDAKIVPGGAKELELFAESFNHLIDRFFQELCQRKNAEESMRRARNEAELSNKAKSIFLAQMTHELRTPLNAIDGYTYMLEASDLQEEQQNYVQNIRYSSVGLLELINQILDFSKMESDHLELESIQFEPKKIWKELEGVMKNQTEQKGLYLDMKLDERIPNVLVGDPLRLKQLLLNLIGNALKFTEKGGITVTAQVEEREQSTCRIRFDVIDSGIGVAEEARRKIFQPFMQSDSSVTRKYGGTGLGLSISSQIVARWGDGSHRLHLRSRKGEGSDFYFRMDFPISEKQQLEPEQIWEKIPDLTGRRVLVVDDNPINVQVETSMLELCNLTVCQATHGEGAIRLLESDPAVQLILLDIRMPGMDGYETAARIRKIAGYESVPIVALTADAMPRIQRKAKQAGMNECLLKPANQKQLFALLQNYLQDKPKWNIVTRSKREENKKCLFDAQYCLEQLGGKRQAMRTILHSFLILHVEDEKMLRTYLEKEDYKSAERLIHTLKGVTGNLGCEPLSKSCERFQKELLHREWEEQKVFFSLWEATWKEIEQVEKSMEEETQETAGGKDPTQWEDSVLLQELSKLCENCDAEAISLVEQHMTQLTEILGKPCTDSLWQYSLRYDFEGMMKCMYGRGENKRCTG